MTLLQFFTLFGTGILCGIGLHLIWQGLRDMRNRPPMATPVQKLPRAESRQEKPVSYDDASRALDDLHAAVDELERYAGIK